MSAVVLGGPLDRLRVTGDLGALPEVHTERARAAGYEVAVLVQRWVVRAQVVGAEGEVVGHALALKEVFIENQ